METLAGMFSSGAGEAAAETGAAAAETGAAEAAAATGGEAGGLAGGLGGTGEFATGATAADIAGAGGTAAAAPGILDTISSAYNAVSPYIKTGANILQTANTLKNALTGGGGQGGPQSAYAPTTAPFATTQTAPGEQPKPNPDDYQRQQEAYWQQLLAGTGNVQPGGGLPPNIEDMIRRQASLYAA